MVGGCKYDVIHTELTEIVQLCGDCCLELLNFTKIHNVINYRSDTPSTNV
jgi:hypothetical protein